MPVEITDDATGEVIATEVHQHDWWERFTCLDEKCVKKCATITVDNRLGARPPDALDGSWSDDSNESEDTWKACLERLNFPGYLQREGLGRFDGF